MKPIKYLILLTCLLSVNLRGQTGNIFWFAAPDISYDHAANSVPLYLYITAHHATTVTVSRPADASFTPKEYTLLADETEQIRLDNSAAFGSLDISEIETYAKDGDASDFIQDKGFLIESSDGEVSAYYLPSAQNNSDIIALKSANALGTDFWVSTQRKYRNFDGYSSYDDDYSGFTVVATEDNTTVYIYPGDNTLESFETETGVITKTLNKGECFAIQADRETGMEPENHIFGIHVTSSADIAIIFYDDSMWINDGSISSWDMMADQTIPTSLIGSEYIALRGWVWDRSTTDVDGEAVFVTPTVDGTDIYIDGVLEASNLSAGEYFEYTLTEKATVISSNDDGIHPIYVNHVSGYADEESYTIENASRELGGAILPPVDLCTGSYSVTVHKTYASSFKFYFNNLMVRCDTAGDPTEAVNSFTYYINDVEIGQINPDHFVYIMDSAFAYYDKTKAHDLGEVAYYENVTDDDLLRVENSSARFHLGVIHASKSPGCRYGYFSDFANSEPDAGVGGYLKGQKKTVCNTNPIQLVANGGTSYTWTTPDDANLINDLSATDIADPYFYPDSAGTYHFQVEIEGDCWGTETFDIMIYVLTATSANFTVSPDDGCSPFTPTLYNLSDTVNAPIQTWTIIPPVKLANAYNISQDSMPMNFDLPLYENHSDSIQTYTIKLVVSGENNACPSAKTKTVTVKPQIEADFSVSDSIGCQPLYVEFYDASSGNLDTNNYLWDFGDNTQSFELNPVKKFYNYSLDDSIYTITLITESPFGCTDTATKEITVHPRIKMVVAADTTEVCSPLSSTLDPKNSIGADTLKWFVTYSVNANENDSTIIRESLDPLEIYHENIVPLNGPDTIWVLLAGVNDYGCTDTAVTRRLIAYPNVTTLFSLDTNIVCDSVPINITNESFGYNLFFEWDFGNNTYSQDTTGESYTKYFLNRFDDEDDAAPVYYVITLDAESEYNCADQYVDSVLVYPYVDANFGINYPNNCSPVKTTITNTSLGNTTNYWTIGITDTIISNDVFPWSFRTLNDNINDTTLITLKTTNDYGCSATLTRKMVVYPRVVADFIFTGDTIGCSPLSVAFLNQSTGGSLIYNWDFGDDISLTKDTTAFTHSYTNNTSHDTTYYITLNVRNQQGCDSSVYDSIQVFAYIDASFDLPVSDSCSPFKIRPDNHSSLGAKVYKWKYWNNNSSYKDSTDVYEPNMPYFPAKDSVTEYYTLQLIAAGASDDEHWKCADTVEKTIKVYPELYADFRLSDSMNCQPLTTSIYNKSNLKADSLNTTFTWYLDSYFQSSETDPDDLTISNSTYYDDTTTLYLYGRTEHNCRDTAQQDIITYSFIAADFSLVPSNICSSDTFKVEPTFTRGGISSIKWNFNNEYTDSTGFTEGVNDVPFEYTEYTNLTSDPVNKFVHLDVWNSHGCHKEDDDTVQVYPKVTAIFTIKDSSVCYPRKIVMNNNSINADMALWTYGDGAGSSDDSPTVTHEFKNFNTDKDLIYTINLKATSEYECWDTLTKRVTIKAKPEAYFYFPTSVACPPFEVEMINKSEGVLPLSYAWDIPDAADSLYAEEPTYIFTNNTHNILDKEITLVVTAANGCKDTTSNTARVYPNVDVDFKLSDTAGCSPLWVDFTGDTTNVLKMYWYVEDKAFSTIKNPSKRFENSSPGDSVYHITFKAVSGYECSADTTKEVTVFSTPVAEFVPSPLPTDYDTINDATTITFYNETVYTEAWGYDWDFGDGNTSTTNEDYFDYTYGSYVWGDIDNNSTIPVTLFAYNTDHPECNDTVENDVIIYAPLPLVNLGEDISGCEPFTVDLSAFTKYNYEDSYVWQFGTSGDTTNEHAPTYTFTESGTYAVRLQVTGDGGTNYDYKIITVYPRPEVDFYFNDSIVFDSSQTKGYDWINFYNETKYASDSGYNWYFDAENNFGGTPDSREANPSWYYTETGEYYVGLIAFTTDGCSDSLIHPTAIQVLSQGYIKFPTAFLVSPDGPADRYDTEQRNKYVFYPLSEGVEEYHLEVYNRWGGRVFESFNVNYGWDGYVDGSPAKQDVYVWRARGVYSNGQPFDLSGDVTLIFGKDEITQ